MLRKLKRIFIGLIVCALLLGGFVTWAAATSRTLPWPLSVAAGFNSNVVGNDPHFGDLRVDRDEFGWFDGTINVENPTESYQAVHVTVALFDGDQNVGTLMGSARLKPRSTSSVDLTSTDPYVPWGDAHVDLSRSPLRSQP